MSYFSAGAWWSLKGVPFATQAEADAAEKADVSSGAGEYDDAFSAAMGRSAGKPARGAPAPTTQGRNGTQPQTATPDPTAFNRQLAPGAQASRNNAGSANDGFWANPISNTLDTASDVYTNPVVSPIGFAAKTGGQTLDRGIGNVFDRGIDAVAQSVISPRTNVSTDLRPSVSGYAQDPVGQAARDFGAPDLVQAGLNPTGFATRTGVNANTAYGMDPAASIQGGVQAGRNLVNDARNAPGVVGNAAAGAANAVNSAANAAAGYATNLFQPSPVTGARAGTTPQPMPQPAMTPQSIMAQNTNTVRPSSAQQDSIVNQMIAQSGVQSGYQDFNSPQYNQTRNAAMGYTSQLANQANNNVAITGLDPGRYDASRSTMNQITGQLQNQANNNVADIQANAAQRDASRGLVEGTANQLNANSSKDINNIYADNQNRALFQSQIGQSEAGLGVSANSTADRTYLDQSIGRGNTTIDQLIALAQAQEGPSAAESLMLNAQERAVRNAYGDAGSLAGGWRSQVTGQRRALGQAAAQQADIAAQLGALRANEAATFRDQQIGALTNAGGLAGNISGLNAQMAQGDQENQRLAYQAQGALRLGKLQDETGFVGSEADRQAVIAQANQANRLNSLLGAGNLQTGMMQSDTNLAQTNASLLAQIRQGNQANSLASLTAAGNNQGTTLNADLGFATNDADVRARREIANQTNATNALTGAANAANNTAQLDANIGTSNADRRSTVDQNNRANSIAALQNAGVLSSNTRAQDVQLSVQDSQALTSRIASAAGLTGTVYAAQLQSIASTADRNQRQQQWEAMQARMPPAELQRIISTAGPALQILGLVL